MKRYAYVLAYYADARSAEDNELSFKHVFIEAKSLDDAYTVGYRTAKRSKTEQLVNDYAFEVKPTAKEKKEVVSMALGKVMARVKNSLTVTTGATTGKPAAKSAKKAR